MSDPTQAPPPAGTACPAHPGKAARYTCSHCGSFGCGTCIGQLRGAVVCRTCVVEGRVSAYGIPWDRRAEDGIPTAWWRTMVMLITRPRELFAALNPEGPLGEGVLFAFLSALPMGVLFFLMYGALGGIGALSGGSMGASEAAMLGGMGLAYLVILPPLAVGGALVLGLLHHGVLRLLGGGNSRLNATLRVVLLASGLNALAGIPCVGYLVGLWVAGLQALGYTVVHRDSGGKAVAAVLSPIVFVCGLGIVAAIAIPSLIALGG